MMTPTSRVCPVCNKPVGTDYFCTPADRYAPYGKGIFNLYPHKGLCYRECINDLRKYAEAQKGLNAQ